MDKLQTQVTRQEPVVRGQGLDQTQKQRWQEPASQFGEKGSKLESGEQGARKLGTRTRQRDICPI